MSIDTSYIKKIRQSLHTHAQMRRDVIKYAGDALHHAKRAIFALHREDMKEAKKKLADARKAFTPIHTAYKKQPAFKDEGAYKAAVEEFVEATMFYQFVGTGVIGKVPGFTVRDDIYIAGLCDVPGELYRYAVRAASNGRYDVVQQCESLASDIIGELIEFDLTKYLRTKFDQAKGAHQKLEIILYELSLRDRE